MVEQTNHTKRSNKTAGGLGYKKYSYIKRIAQRQFWVKFIRSILVETKRFLFVMGANPVFDNDFSEQFGEMMLGNLEITECFDTMTPDVVLEGRLERHGKSEMENEF